MTSACSDQFGPPESIHKYYMGLALAQARKATKLPTNFRVGAILVDGKQLPASATFDKSLKLQSSRQSSSATESSRFGIDGETTAMRDVDAGSNAQFQPASSTSSTEKKTTGHRRGTFDPDDYVLATGYTGELPGNTHAEECALEKYARDSDNTDITETTNQTSDLDDLTHPDDVDKRIGLASSGVGYDGDDDGVFSSSSSDSDGVGGILPEDIDQPTFSPRTLVSPAAGISRSRRLSLSSATASAAAEAAECAAAAAKALTAVDLLLYTTMEPCSRRLSGREPCVSRVLRASFRPSDASKDERGTTKSGSRRAPRRRITHVFVGAKEPADFVENNTGREKLTESGIHYVLVPGLEDQILKVAKT